MYCGNCGKKINEGIKFCPFCGAQTKTPGKLLADQCVGVRSNNNWQKKIPKIERRGLVIGIVFLVCVCAIGFLLNLNKSDLDRIVGTWMLEDSKDDGIEFYKPYSRNGITGDCDVIEDGEKNYGEYEWHESSKRISVKITDNWGSTERLELDYTIVNDDILILSLVGDEDSSIRFIRK